MVPGARQAIDQIDPALPILSAHPLRSLTGLTVLPLTAAGSLAGGFGLLVLENMLKISVFKLDFLVHSES